MAYYNRPLAFTMTDDDGNAFAVDTAAYVAGDCIGGRALVRFSSGGGALLRQIKVLDQSDTNVSFIIHIYSSEPPSDIADNAAFTPADGDGAVEIGQVTVAAGDYVTANGGAYSVAYKFGPDNEIDIPGTALGAIYIYLEALAGGTYAAATDLVLDFTFWLA